MQYPKVSAIIPTYNRAHFIAEAIQSVLDQTFTDFEVIVVDDGSTDNTKQIVNSFKDSRIKYIYQENQGVCVARNAGINASNGEYIIFIDSDDMLIENAIANEAMILDSYPDVALCYCRLYIIDESEHVIGLYKPKHRQPGVYQGTKEIRNLLVHGNYIGTSLSMVRRSSIIDVGLFDPAFSSGSEDFELWVRLAKKYDVAYTTEFTGKVRVHMDSIIGGRRLNEYVRAQKRIFSGIFNDPEMGYLFSNLRPMAYSRLYLRFATLAYTRKDMKTARRYLFRALKMYPKGFFKGLWLPWILQFVKTWIPMPIQQSIRRARHYLRGRLGHYT